MTDIQRLELLSKDIQNQIDELDSFLENGEKFFLKAKTSVAINKLSTIISNLTGYNDGVYSVFENLNAGDNSEELKKQNEVMRDMLKDRLTWEERTDLRIKHGIDLFWGE